MMAFVAVFFSMLAVALLVNYLKVASTQNVDELLMNKSECFVLKYNKIYEAVGIISIVVAAIYGILALTGIANVYTKGDKIALICIILSLSISGVIIVIAVRNIKVEVSDDKIKSWNLFNISKEISWNDIVMVQCSRNMLELKLKTNKTSIKVHRHMLGYIVFEIRMKRNLNKRIYEEALNKMHKRKDKNGID